MTEYKVSYAPPTGKPLGTNFAFKLGTKVLIPIMNVVGKKVWRGGEKLPKTGKIIVASNHVSYLDVLFLTHFLFRNGRAPRYIGKEGVFKVPVIGKIILAAGMVPVARESKDASKALDHAIRLTPIVPIAQWGSQIVMPTYEKKIKFFPRTPIKILVGDPLDLSPWYGKENDPDALREATAFVMRELTNLLEQLRGEKRPVEIFDPHNSTLPRTGNFKKAKKK